MTMRRILILSSLFAVLPLMGRGTYSQSNSDSRDDLLAQATQRGLARENVDALKKNGILISNESYEQIFSVYLSGGNALFITSDSLLNAYHVLYEESIRRLESSMAGQLPMILEAMLRNLKDVDSDMTGNPALVSAAKKRAKLVVGVAMRLVEPNFRLNESELDKILEQECTKIVEARIVAKPDWLGSPDFSFIALDYSRYKPRGFYTQTEKLQRHFRAVSWLQSIPFRIDSDEELLAILMLGNTVGHRRERYQEYRNFFGAYKSFIGDKDDWDIMSAAHQAQIMPRDFSRNPLQLRRKQLNARGGRPKINDQVSLPQADPNQVYESNFRIISAYRTPSAILFQQTTDIRRFHNPSRLYPNGLEVCIALGSNYAREIIVDPHKTKLLQTVQAHASSFNGNSLYFSYLHALRALLDKPEPDAPEFMWNDAWKAKSCNTVLGGWAQLRHTWALQAKQNAFYASKSIIPPGFVEPDPEFFGRMAGLSSRTRRILEGAGAFNTNYDELLIELARLKKMCIDEDREQLDRILNTPSPADFMIMDLLHLYGIYGFTTREGIEVNITSKLELITAQEQDIKNGRIDKHPRLQNLFQQTDIDLKELWNRLESVCRRLEVIAHKQLRGASLNVSEEEFIKNYGISIAGIMMYGGNSYFTPRDDAPRIIDVYYNPQSHGYLHVGIARPRKIYVLYPWQNKTVLCEGAVMPYYEYVSNTRLTDSAWKGVLDSEQRPSVPEWAKPAISGNDLLRPKLKY